MKRTLLPAVACILAACASAPSDVETLAPGKTDIAFVSSTPPLAQTLNRSEGFTVRLKYFLAGAGGDAYYVIPQFDTFLPGRTTTGVKNGKLTDFPRLTARAGEVELYVALPEVLANSTVSQPYQVRFLLVKATSENTSLSEATTRVYQLKVSPPQ